MYSAELRSLFCINFQFEMQVATSLRISIWHGRIKFTFAFRNEKIESICGIQVYCKDLRGAYCYNYNLNMFVQNTYLQQVRRDLTFKMGIKINFLDFQLCYQQNFSGKDIFSRKKYLHNCGNLALVSIRAYQYLFVSITTVLNSILFFLAEIFD